MNILKRELAPISSAAWHEIDEEAKRVLKVKLAARKLVDFVGPLGIEAAAVNLGRQEPIEAGPLAGVGATRRRVQTLVELRADFVLSRAELDDVERGSKDPDLAPLIDAASKMALAEDSVVFNGYRAGGVTGIVPASTHGKLTISDDYERYPQNVAEAARLLRIAGVGGPYAIALGPRCYAGLTQATERGGYPVIELVRRVLDGPIVWAPAVDGAVVMSIQGGDFELTVGQDLAIGYRSHTEGEVRLYLMESMTFRVLRPEAAVALVYAKSGKK